MLSYLRKLLESGDTFVVYLNNKANGVSVFDADDIGIVIGHAVRPNRVLIPWSALDRLEVEVQ